MSDLFNVENLTQFEFGAISVTLLIAGMTIGCLIAWAILNRQNNPKSLAAEKIKEEFEQYKEKVDEHFNKTSDMFKDVTTQYKKLYDHMAVGAIELGNADTSPLPRLEVQDPAADETMAQATDEAIDQPTNETMDQAADEAMAQAADETIDQAAEMTEQTSVPREEDTLENEVKVADGDSDSEDENRVAEAKTDKTTPA